MTNAELIAGLRECATVGDCRKCKMHDEYSYDMCAIKLLLAAADALETAEKRIEQLERDLKTREAEREIMQDTIKICEEAADRYKAQLPKEGEWKKILQNEDGTSDYQCSACLGIIMDVPDDDEHPLCSFCPNCGARMKWKPKSVENKQVAAYEYIAGTRVDFAMEDLTDCGRQILLGLKKDDKKEK